MRLRDLQDTQPFVKRFLFYTQKLNDLIAASKPEMFDFYSKKRNPIKDEFEMKYVYGTDFITLPLVMRQRCMEALAAALDANGHKETVPLGYQVWKLASNFEEMKRTCDDINRTAQAFCTAYRTQEDGTLTR